MNRNNKNVAHKHEHPHEHSHSHDHEFDLTENNSLNKIRLTFVILLNLVITIAEIIGGLFSRSLSLLSDAFHNFGDTSSLILSWVGIKISNKAKDKRKTFGYKRAHIIVAFLNSQFLLIICIFLIIEAIKKFFSPVEIKTSIMLIVASIGLIANLLSTLILHKDSKHSLNIRSSYLHLLGDTFSSVGVILGGILIKFFKLYFVDPLITLSIAIYIGYESIKIIIKTINILMQSSADLNYEEIKKDIESIPNVNSLHHVHTWLSDEKTIYFEAHVEVCNIKMEETNMILEKINHLLHDKYDISHTTIQFELDRCDKKDIFNI